MCNSHRENPNPLGDGEALAMLIRTELASTPVQHWGFCFPCHLAVWRFLEAKRPGTMGQLNARFKDEPVFEGKGAEWFCGVLGNSDEYMDLLEALMYPITSSLAETVKLAVQARGHFLDSELPPLQTHLVERLASLVLKERDAAS